MARKGKNKECVAIARDVLAQFKIGKYEIGYGYLENPEVRWVQGDVQAAIKKTLLPCLVCAIGALFVSTVRKYDDFIGSGDFIEVERMKDKLREFFTKRETASIEDVFEEFGDRIYLPDLSRPERMKAIMQSIIKHDGNFALKNL